MASWFWGCHPTIPETIADAAPSTNAEVLDTSVPTSSTLIKSIVVQSTYKDADSEGYRYEYRYYYDANNRLTKLDYWGYILKYTQTQEPGPYANFVHKVATLEYSSSGELSNLRMHSYDKQGQLSDHSLDFPVKKEGSELVIYGQSQWYPNPFASEPILRISATGRILQLPCPWNGQPNTQFALNTFGYDAANNLSSMTLSYVDRTLTKQQTSLIKQIQHTQYVLNPFGQNPAYGAAHFLARGGYNSTYMTSLLDFSQKMVLADRIERWSMSETGPDFSPDGIAQTNYSYRYNARQLPIVMKRKQFVYDQSAGDSVSFSYY